MARKFTDEPEDDHCLEVIGRSLALMCLHSANMAGRSLADKAGLLEALGHAAFSKAVAVVVMFSPDDEAKLRAEFLKATDGPDERTLMGQPSPNVLFEAGMAFGSKPDKTVLVQVGDVRPFSDIGGRHVVHLSDSPESRQELATKLESAGCIVDLSGSDWLREGAFSRSTEAERIGQVLLAAGGNKSRAAKLLGIERKTLYRKLDELGL